MINTRCICGAELEAGEAGVNQQAQCASCGAALRYACAEAIGEGAGAADFDGRLHVVAGPAHVGEQFFLGGVPEIEIGKLADRHIALAGPKVSRLHSILQRLDFGPSRWKIIDNNSTNGLFVNGERISEHELADGDQITVGDFDLQFASIAAPAPALVTAKALPPGAQVCPGCGKAYSAKAKICVSCGIDLKTGRPIVTSKGLDENELAIRADTWTRVVSWIMPLGVFPIASEALGTKKPLASWAIFGVTVFVSVAFLISAMAGDYRHRPIPESNLLQWDGDRSVPNKKVAQIQQKLQDEIKQLGDEMNHASPGRQMRLQQEQADLQELIDKISAMTKPPADAIGFQWYQLFTSALLHDTSSPLQFFFHLGGNMVFFLVFGIRVNELIGNWRMAIVYPLLALGAGLINHVASMHTSFHPSLGASGAIMGLAGVYFVFFPVQRVFLLIWIRGGIFTGWRCFYKIFKPRGFWLLVVWLGFNDVLPTFLGMTDGVAHWAHLGGFITGVCIGLALLLSRQVNARGGDLLSVMLGKKAWGLVGRPTDWHGAAIAAQ